VISRSQELSSGLLNPIVKFKLPSHLYYHISPGLVIPKLIQLLIFFFCVDPGAGDVHCVGHSAGGVGPDINSAGQAGEISPINYFGHYTENHATHSDQCISRLEFNIYSPVFSIIIESYVFFLKYTSKRTF